MNIEVEKILKEYTHGEQRIIALNDCSLTISNGLFISVIGRSGSGKSTLLNIIAGLTNPTSGRVLFEGRDIFSFSDEDLSLYRNEKIGCLPQQQSVLPNLTVLDNVRLPYHIAKRKGDCTEEALKLLTLFGIGNLAGRMPNRLSGGQLKRVAIARALINKPCLLLADEPTGDLDSQTTEEIIKTYRRMVDGGMSILMVTHDYATAEYSDKCYEMKDGVLSLLTKCADLS